MKLDRKAVNALSKEFVKLLDEKCEEQIYQEYLEKNSRLIPREFIQNHGVHLDLVFRKLSLAKDYTTDFFYLSKSSADWHCIMVEIEKPQSKYFKEKTNDFHQDFQKGLMQINRWRAWFENPSNLEGFVNGTIASVRVPPIMTRNPCSIKYVLVHGRRSEFEGNEIRKALIRAQERNDFHILSYDSLMESLHTKGPLYIAIRKNEYVEIVSKDFVGEGLFSCVDSTLLKINNELRSNILAAKSNWFEHSVRGGLMLDEVLPKIGACNI
jgi:hypothetical protein